VAVLDDALVKDTISPEVWLQLYVDTEPSVSVPVPYKLTVVGNVIDWSVPALAVGATFVGGVTTVVGLCDDPPPQAESIVTNKNVMIFIE
jgi:hypothetical protein